MKVLLTGASGFVGSHILDRLRASEIDTVIVLRSTSDRRYLERHLATVEVRTGSIAEPASLLKAMAGITHVIHCAGCTKAARSVEFFQVNQVGTRNVVEAVNARAGRVQRLLLVSSLAAAGPAGRENPAREPDAPQPVSHYGKSKLCGELEVREQCRVPYAIVRPPAVYGPRDQGFFSMFKAVENHLLPRPSKHQALSLVFVSDLAAAIVGCLQHPAAAGKTYFVAAHEVVTGREMAQEIAVQMGQWTIPCPLPTALLWPICLAQEIRSRVTGKASLLNLQKFAELRAPGWVCDPSLLEREIGFECKTKLKAGIAETLDWYRANGWL